MKCVNKKLWDILGCFHYILNAPRIIVFVIRWPIIYISKCNIRKWHAYLIRCKTRIIFTMIRLQIYAKILGKCLNERFIGFL